MREMVFHINDVRSRLGNMGIKTVVNEGSEPGIEIRLYDGDGYPSPVFIPGKWKDIRTDPDEIVIPLPKSSYRPWRKWFGWEIDDGLS